MPSPKASSTPTHFRSYSSLRSTASDDNDNYGLSPLNRDNSRTPLEGAQDSNYAPPYPQHMEYPPAGLPPPGGLPAHLPPPGAFTTVPLNDKTDPEQTPTVRTAVGFMPASLPTSPSHSTINTYPQYHHEKSKGSKGSSPSTPQRQSYDAFAAAEAYNPAAAKDRNMRFAEGDAGTNAFSRFYLWLIDLGIIVRWALFIIPVVAILWIPGIIDYARTDKTREPEPLLTQVWEVDLRWWSIWLTIVWVTLWGSKAFFMIFPQIFRQTVASIVPSTKQYVAVVANLGTYAKYLLWAIFMNISFTPLVKNHFTGKPDSGSASALNWIQKFLIAVIICMAVLLAEKGVIQLIALAFHRDAYADRLHDQKMSTDTLVALYIRSKHIPGTDIADDTASTKTKGTQMPKFVVRKALKGLKSAAQNTTTALGNVASEMAGSSVLQTNSPHNKVKAALTSANKSRALARRLFYSFRAPGADCVTIQDILPCFGWDQEKATAAFNTFDRDGNGDATRDEMDAALMELHRERMALEASIRDLDGAVKRLDEILIMLVLVIDILIIISMTGAADSKFNNWVSSSATFVLSLSWMIGATTQEILSACIFVFVKHPYDVGDRVDIDGSSYTVAKVELLSTSFKRVDGKFVWIAHNVLTTKVIENVRRSGATSEKFVFEVAFDTSFEQLQTLRDKMLRFCKDNSRDFLPAFDVTVADMPAQGKMILNADIKYKSNWQLGALKVQRRNKWICQLKIVLAELQIWGPAGAGNPSPGPADPTRYTEVPWAEVLEAEQAKAVPHSPPPSFAHATAVHLHSRMDSTTDLFDDSHGGLRTPGPNTPGPNLNTPLPSTSTAVHPHHIQIPGPSAQSYFPPRI